MYTRYTSPCDASCVRGALCERSGIVSTYRPPARGTPPPPIGTRAAARIPPSAPDAATWHHASAPGSHPAFPQECLPE
eukprot:1195418-Prorocentrum_minimum.AAC.2